MRCGTILLVGLGMLLGAAPATGQGWDVPSFFAPRQADDIGVYAVKPDGSAGAGFAVIWRQSGNINLGVRGGLADGGHVQLGAEFFGPLNLGAPGAALQFSWIVGGGATFNDATLLRIPLGVSAGMELGTGGMRITPYVHPRVALSVLAYDTPGGERTDTDVGFDIDVGADASIGESLVLRVGVSLGDAEAFGAGIAYRMGRRVVVR